MSPGLAHPKLRKSSNTHFTPVGSIAELFPNHHAHVPWRLDLEFLVAFLAKLALITLFLISHPCYRPKPRFTFAEMKVKIKRWDAVAAWRWNMPDDDMCGIC